VIGEDARARLGELAMKAFDAIVEQYGDEAEARLEDAVLIWEVSVPNPDQEEGGEVTEMNGHATTDRAPVAGGLAQCYANRVLFPAED
jgi:hypothetical protein